jgi:hypothetical protein
LCNFLELNLPTWIETEVHVSSFLIDVKKPAPVCSVEADMGAHDNPGWVSGKATARVLAYQRYPEDK